MNRASAEQEAYRPQSCSLRVRDLPATYQPREQMARMGPTRVDEEILLAVLLRAGIPGMNVVELARGLLRDYGTLSELMRAGPEELAARPGLGPVKAQVLAAALELGRRLSQEAVPDRPRISSPEDVARILREEARALEQEVFWTLALDTRNKLLRSPLRISRGLLNSSQVHAREVFRGAIRLSAAAVILAHNHPSGDPSPSSDDLRVTRRMVESGRLLDIPVLDHVIVTGSRGTTHGRSSFYSLRESGFVDFGD